MVPAKLSSFCKFDAALSRYFLFILCHTLALEIFKFNFTFEWIHRWYHCSQFGCVCSVGQRAYPLRWHFGNDIHHSLECKVTHSFTDKQYKKQACVDIYSLDIPFQFKHMRLFECSWHDIGSIAAQYLWKHNSYSIIHIKRTNQISAFGVVWYSNYHIVHLFLQ